MNVVPAVIDEIIRCQPYLRSYQPPDGSIELRFCDTKGSVRQENDRLYITRYANTTPSYQFPLPPMWSPVAVATISLFDADFLTKILRVTKEMFNILPAIREKLDQSHPNVFWRQISDNCIETTSEPQVTIIYDPDKNAIILTTCHVSESHFTSYQSHEISTTIDLLNPNFLDLILKAFPIHRMS